MRIYSLLNSPRNRLNNPLGNNNHSSKLKHQLQNRAFSPASLGWGWWFVCLTVKWNGAKIHFAVELLDQFQCVAMILYGISLIWGFGVYWLFYDRLFTFHLCTHLFIRTHLFIHPQVGIRFWASHLLCLLVKHRNRSQRNTFIRIVQFFNRTKLEAKVYRFGIVGARLRTGDEVNKAFRLLVREAKRGHPRSCGESKVSLFFMFGEKGQNENNFPAQGKFAW